jgi:hypothetical protein
MDSQLQVYNQYKQEGPDRNIIDHGKEIKSKILVSYNKEKQQEIIGSDLPLFKAAFYQ